MDPVCGTSCGTCDAGTCSEAGTCAGGRDLFVQLTWDTANTDLDLSLRRQTDALCSNETCNYQTCKSQSAFRVEWDGVPGVSSGDPLLDLDDIDGIGPENIIISMPLPGTYVAAVTFINVTANPTQSTTARLTAWWGGAFLGTMTRTLAAPTGSSVEVWDGIRITVTASEAAMSFNTSTVGRRSACGAADGGVVPLGAVGAPCASSEECAGGGALLGSGCFKPDAGYPGGYCTTDCSIFSACPQFSTCVGVLCYAACTSDSQCRQGYFCSVGDGTGGTCMPRG